MNCIVNATGQVSLPIAEDAVAQGVTDQRMKEEGFTNFQIEEFWVRDESEDCCQIPQ